MKMETFDIFRGINAGATSLPQDSSYGYQELPPESSGLVNPREGLQIVTRNNISRTMLTGAGPQTTQGADDSEQLRVWLSAVPLVTLMIINVLANGAIILIFIRQKCIRRCRNIYILSIAVADFFIGLSMPFSIIETLNLRWTLWPLACWFFLMVRYSLFFISFISIILLTVDRWWSINFPFSYRVRQSRTMAATIVVCCWLMSFILHVPLVLGLEGVNMEQYSKDATYCRIPKERNFIFTVCAFFIEYVLPMGFLFILNLGIYLRLLKRRNTKKLRRSLSTTDSYMVYNFRKTSSDSGSGSGVSCGNACNVSYEDNSDSGVLSQGAYNDSRRHTVYLYNSRKMTVLSPKIHRHSIATVKKAKHSRHGSVDTSGLLKHKHNSNTFIKQSSFPTRKQSDDVVKDYLVRQDKKAILSLGLLTMVAFVCWTPYAITSMIGIFCEDCVPSWMNVFFSWILAANSAVNPFLYGIGNPDFRKVLRAWKPCCHQPTFRFQESLLYCHFHQNTELDTLQEFNLEHTMDKNASL